MAAAGHLVPRYEIQEKNVTVGVKPPPFLSRKIFRQISTVLCRGGHWPSVTISDEQCSPLRCVRIPYAERNPATVAVRAIRRERILRLACRLAQNDNGYLSPSIQQKRTVLSYRAFLFISPRAAAHIARDRAYRAHQGISQIPQEFISLYCVPRTQYNYTRA